MGLDLGLGLVPGALGDRDVTSSPIAAYSTARSVIDGYSGNIIRLRRDSDDAEQDFGVDGSGDLDTAAITTFLGAANGFFVAVYDQVGSGDLAQATAANQPPYVASGTNSLPSAQFDGTNYSLVFDDPHTAGQTTTGFAIVFQPDTVVGLRETYASTGGSPFSVELNATGGLLKQNGLIIYNVGAAGWYAANLPYITEILKETDSIVTTVNGTALNTTANSAALALSAPGTASISAEMSGYFNELVFWPDNLGNMAAYRQGAAAKYGITLP